MELPVAILVHGAFADSSSWADITSRLERLGIPVVTVRLPLTSLEDDVAAARKAIDGVHGPALLVGHSWGGAVISEAGNASRVAGLVYIAAGAPDSGQSFRDWWVEYGPAPKASCLTGTVTLAAWRTKPCWYIVANEDRTIPPTAQIEAARRMKAEMLCLPTGHIPMLAQPESVAAFIAQAAKSVSAS